MTQVFLRVKKHFNQPNDYMLMEVNAAELLSDNFTKDGRLRAFPSYWALSKSGVFLMWPMPTGDCELHIRGS